jgi:hypothetical protein
VEDRQDILELLDEQCDDYRAMYRLGLEQRHCLEREDLEALGNAFAQMHRLMARIRLRQARLPQRGMSQPAEVERRYAVLEDLLIQVQALNQDTRRLAQQMLERTQVEMRQFGQGQRAVRGYREKAVHQARLYDGQR